MELVSVQCPGCGADLPPRAPAGDYTCDYCASRFRVQQARSAHTVAGVQLDVGQLAAAIVQAQQQQQRQQPGGRRLPGAAPVVNYGPGAVPQPDPAHHHAYAVAQQTAKTGRNVALVVVGLSVLGMAIPGVILATKSGAFEDVPGLGAITEKVEHLMWDHVAGPPAVVTIAGKPAVIGRTRKVLDGDSLFIDAYDTQTVARLWRIGPLGNYSEAYQAVRFVVAGDRLVLSDAQSKLHLHDVANGERLQSKDLTDKVDMLCVPPNGPADQVWVHQIDEKSHLLDVNSGTLSESAAPEGCFASQWEAERAADGAEPPLGPKVDGVEIKRVLTDGDVGVALGVKSPGTPVPYAIGFDPADGSARWNTVVSSVDAATVRQTDPVVAFSGDRVLVVYGAGQAAWFLAALDAKTGAKIWEEKLRPLFSVDWISGLQATPDHVFLSRMSSLEVYDAKSGARLGTIGKETYK